MKFLILAGFADSLINFRGHLIRDLISHGFEVHAAAPQFSASTQFTLESWGCQCHPVSMARNTISPYLDLKTCIQLILLFNQIKPHYFLAYTIKPVIYGTIIASLFRTPKIISLITGLGYAFSKSKSDSFFRQLTKLIAQSLYKISLAHVSLIFFQNPDDFQTFKNLKLFPNTTPYVIVNGSGVDLSFYKTHTISSAQSTTPIDFLLIARLLKDKGIVEFIDSARILKYKFGDRVSFTLAGWIDHNPNSIDKHFLDKAIEDGVIKFLGKLDDVRPAIESASVYVLPSYREGTPRTVLEAMAMRKPIITTDAPGCRETVTSGENGFLIPIKSTASLVTAMERFILDPSLIETMGNSSLIIATQKYDVHSVNAVMLNAMGIRV